MKRHITTIILLFCILASRAQNLYIHTHDGQTFTTPMEEIVSFDADYLRAEIDPEVVPDDEIWYVTTNGRIIIPSGDNPFDVNIVSNTYENGCGVIKCDGPITKIGSSAFRNCFALSELYLPDCVRTIGNCAIIGTQLREFRVPESLTVPDYGFCYSPRYWSMFYENKYLERFYGNHCSEDGRCLIIDGIMCGFASCGITEYTVPAEVKTITNGVFSAGSMEWPLEAINFSEGLEYIDGHAFESQTRLKYITLPNSLLDIHGYAFMGCTNIKGFYGNDNFHTPDNKCLLCNKSGLNVPDGKWVCAFAGSGITEYTIPEGVVGIENYGMSGYMSGGRDLQKLTFPNSFMYATATAFLGCDNLEAIYGNVVSDDNRCIVTDTEDGAKLNALIARKNMPKDYHIPDNITIIGYSAIEYCNEVESITMSDQVKVIEGYAFECCDNLKSVTLSAGLQDCSGYNLFSGCYNLETVYLRSPLPPKSDSNMVLTEYPNLIIYVPEETISLYKTSNEWKPWRDFFQPYNYGDVSEFFPDYYFSTDYSQDGMVVTLQTATEGAGIDIVLMGDGYSDRQIADGTYLRDMHTLYDNMFTEEPYKTFRDMFNVYYVTAVSMTEGLEYGHTALSSYFGSGTFVGGNDATCFSYAQNALDEARMDEALVIVSVNEDAYAGTCFMYYPSQKSAFGAGPSGCYFPRGGDEATYASLLHHEALGHGFAKLADEYAYEYKGTIPVEAIEEYDRRQNEWGWYLNVDFSDSPEAIRWAQFIADERYTQEGIGVFEGALTYWNGVWRPTENSIMRYNVGGFNAPSREAIFNRIHHLAYGAEWQPSYEAFVAYDAINRTPDALRARALKASAVRNDLPPLPAPVVMNKTWHNAGRAPVHTALQSPEL